MAVKTRKKKRIKIKFNNRKAIAAAVSVLLAAGVLIISLSVSASHKRRRFDYSSVFGSQSKVSGIDVSYHNGKIDWDEAADEIDFAFIRAGYRGYGKNGTLAVDKKAKENLKGANKAGVPAGVYFYTQSVSEEEAEQEAKYLISIIKSFDIDLPVIIDFEYPYNNTGDYHGRLYNADLSPDRATDVINAFCTTVAKAGYTPGVYASTNTYEQNINAKRITKDAVIWVAEYNSKVNYSGPYDIWQYSKTGSCSGIQKDVDLNEWYLNGKQQ